MENVLAKNVENQSTSEVLRSLAKEARKLMNTPEEEASEDKNKTEKKKKPESNPFSLTLCEYPDLIISKKCRSGYKHLVIMPSAKAAFIKTETKDGTDSEVLTPELFVKFTSGMPDVMLPDGFWTPAIKRGVIVGRAVCKIVESEEICALIRHKLISNLDLSNEGSLSLSHGRLKDTMSAFKLCPKLLVEFKDDEKIRKFIIRERVTAERIEKQFGLENARDFLRAYSQSLISIDSSAICERFTYVLRGFEQNYARDMRVIDARDTRVIDGRNIVSAIPYIPMQYSAFKDYVLYSSVRMGFALNLRQFFDTWRDTLDLQMQVYGKIREKYPEDMLLLHNQLAYKRIVLGERIDKENFEKQVEKAKQYEGIWKGFVFVAPKSRQDFLDEATAQSNCLAGYVKSFTNGSCLILFMRHKDTPQESYITVEIANGAVVQSKLARNLNPSDYENEVLDEWIAKCNLKIFGSDEKENIA